MTITVEHGGLRVSRPRPFIEAAARAIGVDRLMVIDTGFDLPGGAGSQWDDGANALVIGDRVAICDERNEQTNARLATAGFEVMAIPWADFGGDRGGPRCMCVPVLRDQVADGQAAGDPDEAGRADRASVLAGAGGLPIPVRPTRSVIRSGAPASSGRFRWCPDKLDAGGEATRRVSFVSRARPTQRAAGPLPGAPSFRRLALPGTAPGPPAEPVDAEADGDGEQEPESDQQRVQEAPDEHPQQQQDYHRGHAESDNSHHDSHSTPLPRLPRYRCRGGGSGTQAAARR